MVIPHFNADKNYTFAYRAVNYFLNLDVPKNLPNGIEIMNPYTSNIVKDVVEKFYNKFFNDDNKRIFILGINPGRFGGGVTGISFTDPLALVKYCGIENEFIKKAELSSNFVYTFISRLGSVEKFYSKYFISALFPLALVKNGTNYNYYDESKLFSFFKPLIIDSLKNQIGFGASSDYAISLGRKNGKYLKEINDEYHFFDSIIILDHPRYIMQYKRKLLNKYFDEYASVISV